MTTGELPDIVERLSSQIAECDHAGSHYDKQVATVLRAAKTEITRLRATPPGSPLIAEREALKAFLIAWDSLPTGNYSSSEISRWLNSNQMKTALAAIRALSPVVVREPIGWRVRVRQGDATYHLYTEALPFEPWTGSPITVLSEPEPFFTSPPPASAVREATIEECAKVADGWMAVHGHHEIKYVSARKYACDAVEDIADAIRALSIKGTADESTGTGCGRRGGNCQCSSKEECINQ